MANLETIFKEELGQVIKDNQHFDTYIQKMDIDNFKDLLKSINGYVRNIPEQEYGFHAKRMFVGDMISASPEVRDKVLKKTLQALKQTPSRKTKGVLMYNIINDLHLFPDGNGRSSRLVYEMFSNLDFKLERSPSFSHNEDDKALVNHYDFEKTNGISGASDMARAMLPEFLKKVVEEYNLPREFLNFTSIRGQSSNIEASRSGNAVYMPQEVSDSLTPQQRMDINHSVGDAQHGGIMSLIIVAAERGTAQAILDTNNERLDSLQKSYNIPEEKMTGYKKTLVFQLDCPDWAETPEEIAKEKKKVEAVFKGWGKEDYLKTIALSDKMNERFFDLLIDKMACSEETSKEKTSSSGIAIQNVLSSRNAAKNSR